MSNNDLKSYQVVIKMTKEEKLSGGTISMWSLNQKISGLVFIKLHIPVLKYSRDMERGSKHFH